MFLSAKLQYSFRLYKEILKILFFFSHFSLKYGAGIIVNRTLVFFVGIGKRKRIFKFPSTRSSALLTFAEEKRTEKY